MCAIGTVNRTSRDGSEPDRLDHCNATIVVDIAARSTLHKEAKAFLQRWNTPWHAKFWKTAPRTLVPLQFGSLTCGSIYVSLTGTKIREDSSRVVGICLQARLQQLRHVRTLEYTPSIYEIEDV